MTGSTRGIESGGSWGFSSGNGWGFDSGNAWGEKIKGSFKLSFLLLKNRKVLYLYKRTSFSMVKA
ncbi:hypothetical protein FDF26_17665 [Clostridium botulinum]|nr:hypothetical protein [Clostridium botulinum]